MAPSKDPDKQNFLDQQQDRLLKFLDDYIFKPLDRVAIAFRIGLLVLLSVWFGFTALNLWQDVSFNIIHRPIHHLNFAVGDRTGESYILGNAIKQVVEKYHPNLQIELLETSGSAENLAKLEAGDVQLATAQSDIPPSTSARAIAVLYQDLFQLVVHDQSGIQQLTDLRGKRIGVQKQGGQILSFLEIADHYNLKPEDFTFIGTNDQDSRDAFRQERVDAVFHVRALGNRIISELIQSDHGQLLPIEQADAMKIQHPAFTPGTIPKGTYKGSLPPVPAKDIPSVAIQKLLLTHKNTNSKVIREISATLEEHRQDIINRIPSSAAEVKPLIASINAPSSNIGIPLHPGAIAYYKPNNTSFILKNANFLAVVVSIAVPVASWIWELKSRAEQRGKSLSEGYVEQVLGLMKGEQNSTQSPEDRQIKLYNLFDEVAEKLVAEAISQESFRTFNEAYKTAREKIEREIQQQQQERTANHIQTLICMMQNAKNYTRGNLQKEIEQVLANVLDDLAKGNISQESFQTFVEVYGVTKDLLNKE